MEMMMTMQMIYSNICLNVTVGISEEERIQEVENLVLEYTQ